MKHTPLKRKTPLRRSAPGRASRPRKQSLPKKLRTAVYERAGGLCDCCGEWMDPETFDVHHRQLRSRGGKHTIENLVALKHEHHMWVHQHPAEATERGLMVSAYADPATIPVRRFDGNLYLPRWTWDRYEEDDQ